MQIVAPSVKYVNRKKQGEIILSFGQLGIDMPGIAIIGVIGPWRRKPFIEKREPIGGYDCGEPYAHVVICTDRTLKEKWLNPLDRDERVLNIIKSLNDKEISVSVEEVLLGQYEGKDPKQLLEYTFGPSKIDVAYKRL